jgi:sulfofructose kinase
MSSNQVVSVGIATIDNIVRVERFPEENERVLALENLTSVGGPATVAAITMARLGIEVSLLATVGNDPDGDFLLEVLRREKVDTSLVERVDNPTSKSTIVISGNSRTIMVKPERIAPKRRDLSQVDWLHVDHFGAEVIGSWGITRGAGPKLSIDIGYPVANLKSSGFDIYAPSEKITNDVSTAAQDRNWVVISHGERGSAYSDGSQSGRAPAFEVDLVSTLGAGDVFHGALLAARIWGREIASAVRFANAVAALSCRGLDGYSAVPSRQEAEEFIASMKVSI